MNHLSALTHLKNTYFVMRHGQSLANCKGLIVSTPENGLLNYGLSEKGQQQAKTSTIKLIDFFDKKIQIISSDFKRAKETTEIVHQLIPSKVEFDERLRERNFGDFELTRDTNYQITWNNDAKDASHTLNDAESANAVMSRVTRLIVDLEERYSQETLLLVAHGDTLQILQTAFQKQAASKQRELTHLETAEIRRLNFI